MATLGLARVLAIGQSPHTPPAQVVRMVTIQSIETVVIAV